MIDDTKFVRNGPAFENHHTLNGPTGNLLNEKVRMNIQQGWRHHADLPLRGGSKFPSYAFHHRTAPTGFMEVGHVT